MRNFTSNLLLSLTFMLKKKKKGFRILVLTLTLRVIVSSSLTDVCVKHQNMALSFSANQLRACNRSQLASPRGGSAHRRWDCIGSALICLAGSCLRWHIPLIMWDPGPRVDPERPTAHSPFIPGWDHLMWTALTSRPCAAEEAVLVRTRSQPESRLLL